MFGMSLLPISLIFIMYAVWTYLWRAEKIRTRDTNRWDDPVGPAFLALVLLAALSCQFFVKLNEFVYPVGAPGVATVPAAKF